MNDEYWLIFDSVSGLELGRGAGVVGQAGIQSQGQGWNPDWDVLVIPRTAYATLPTDLSIVKEYWQAQVDAQAEAVRQSFITPGSGQALEYQQSAEQARALIAGGTDDYPMLQSDVDAGTIDPRTGDAVSTLEEAADLILYREAQWRDAGALIKTARLLAKQAIGAATSPGAVKAAAVVDWVTVVTGG